MYKIIGGDEREYGPVTPEQLRLWISEGRVNTRTKTQVEGSTEWKPLGSIPEFAAALGIPPPVSSMPPLVSSAPVSPTGHIPSYLAQAILCTLCCCLPFGIVAIVYAAQVNSKLAGGDYHGALNASQNARMWCWVAFALGLVSCSIASFISMANSSWNFHPWFHFNR